MNQLNTSNQIFKEIRFPSGGGSRCLATPEMARECDGQSINSGAPEKYSYTSAERAREREESRVENRPRQPGTLVISCLPGGSHGIKYQPVRSRVRGESRAIPALEDFSTLVEFPTSTFFDTVLPAPAADGCPGGSSSIRGSSIRKNNWKCIGKNSARSTILESYVQPKK